MHLTPDVLNGCHRALQTLDWDIGLLAPARDGISDKCGPRLKALHVPTVVMWGEHDTWISPPNASQLNQDNAGSELAIIPNARHMPHDEQSEKFNRLVFD